MNLILCYDTETTGLPLWSSPSDHPDQPHLMQLAACLVDVATREVVQSLDVIIRPNGWSIPEEVVAVHGITTEMASDIGVREETALQLFMQLWRERPRLGHNEPFDMRIIRIAMKRYMTTELFEKVGDDWKTCPAECTQRLSTPIVALPLTEKMKRAGRHHHKTAKLSEAYEHFFGEPLVGAHSAMVDVKACLDIFWKIKDRQQEREDGA